MSESYDEKLANKLDAADRLIARGYQREPCGKCNGYGAFGSVQCWKCEGRGYNWVAPIVKAIEGRDG